MGKVDKSRKFQTLPQLEEVIQENNHSKSSWKITEKSSACSLMNCDSISVDYTKESSNSSNSLSSSSSSSSDFMEDASSSSSSSLDGPLFQLSDLMDQLPIKRGLSNYYQGKSQSFASLAGVERLEDLAKGKNPYKKRIKSYCGGLDDHRFCSPKSNITKKVSSRNPFSSSVLTRKCSNNFVANCKPPQIPVEKHF